MQMKRSFFAYMAAAIVIVGTSFAVSSCGGAKKKQEEQARIAAEKAKADSLAQVEFQRKSKEAESLVDLLPEEPVFNIRTNLGTIKVKLYKDTPKHRRNFAKLALSGFYDGLLFHRVINGFMIQGGDPLTKDTTQVASYGTGGPGYQIPAEILPQYRHKKGAMAAARRGDQANPERESSGSQFYLVQDENACRSLDGQYTIFGETLEGLDVIDKIAAVPVSQGKNLPLNPVKIISITLDESSKPVPPAAEGE